MTIVGMYGHLELVCLATEAPMAIDRGKPKKRHGFFGPGPCACHQIGLPMDQAACRQSPTVSRLALSKFVGFVLRSLDRQPQARLHFPTLSDIPADGSYAHNGTRGVVDRGNRELHLQTDAVFAQPNRFILAIEIAAQ